MSFRRFRPGWAISLLGLFGLIGLAGIGVIAGTAITANRGAPVALGAGYIVATACDENVTVKAETALHAATGQLYVATIALSDLNQNATTGCGQRIMEAALKINGQMIYTSWSIPAASTNNTFTFGGANDLVSEYYASTVLNPFQADGLTSIAITQLGSWNKSLISAGNAHACAVTSSGAAKCWGIGSFGELGNGANTNKLTATAVTGLSSGVIAISASSQMHTCAVLSTGAARCWGYNNYNELGDGTKTTRLTPTAVTGLSSGVSAISSGYTHTCAVLSTGAARCWGRNGSGQIGDGTSTDRSTSVAVSGLSSGVSAISTGKEHSCALLSSGGVKCWGWNGNGRLGDGTTQTSLVPVDVSGLSSGVIAITSGLTHNCALLSTGGVKCWGQNSDGGQLGDGTAISKSIPVDVSGLSSGVTAISSKGNHTCALLSTGAAKCWGANSQGQLGDGTQVDSSTPVNVSTLSSGVRAISAGSTFSCALLGRGVAKCWGANYGGQIGDGTTTRRLTPTTVVGLP